jgi:hypothetical protein
LVEIRRKWIVRREVWFDEPWERDGADLIVFYHWSEAISPFPALDVHSLELDLTQAPSSIWKGFTATARNLINRGGKDGLSFQMWTGPPRKVIDQFFAFRRRFALERGVSSADPTWMYAYAAQGALILTLASAPDGSALVWHSYSRVPGWVRLLHSVSLSGESDPEERKRIGCANRFLHWMDVLECQRLRIEHYDFGGWYSGTSDEKLLRINSFKEQFGGRRTHRYHSMLAPSAKGKLYLMARRTLKRDSSLVHYV